MSDASSDFTEATPDAQASFVDRLPRFLRPYFRLMRADRPVGVWLLFLPCVWGVFWGMAVAAGPESHFSIASFYVILFAIGAFVMRSAGCAYNDIVDRDIDAKVARTANRPLPSGRIKPWAAWALTLGLCLVGLLVLLQFNRAAIFTGLLSVLLVAAYPFMKRITWWPQAWLGMTFNWGILVGFVAIAGGMQFSAFLIYVAAIFWTLGYDTIYAHQDKEDDALIGVKSSALATNGRGKLVIGGFYLATTLLLLAVGWLGNVTYHYYLMLSFPVLHFTWQVLQLDENDGDQCLFLFKSNRDSGILISLAFLGAWLF